MPEFTLPGISNEMSHEDLLNAVARMKKELTWLLNQMDSLNIPRINTNITQIKSEDGETYINGPVLEQYDSSGTLRLKQGLNIGTDTFEFILYNASGTPTIDLDSNGELIVERGIFKGDITTEKDIYVGNNIYMNATTYDGKGVYMTPATWIKYVGLLGLSIESDKDIKLFTGATINFQAANGINFVLYGGDMKLPYNSYLGVVTAANKIARITDVDSAVAAAVDGATGTFTASSGETITVENGLITDIS
jgi:hypothetical protein